MSKHQIRPDIWRMGELARDVMAETVSRDRIFGREQEEEKMFSCSAYHEQVWKNRCADESVHFET